MRVGRSDYIPLSVCCQMTRGRIVHVTSLLSWRRCSRGCGGRCCWSGRCCCLGPQGDYDLLPRLQVSCFRFGHVVGFHQFGRIDTEVVGNSSWSVAPLNRIGNQQESWRLCRGGSWGGRGRRCLHSLFDYLRRCLRGLHSLCRRCFRRLIGGILGLHSRRCCVRCLRSWGIGRGGVRRGRIP